MLNRRIGIALTVIGVILFGTDAISAAAPKKGAVCSKLGKIQNYSGKQFTCISKNKKLVWNSGVVIKSAVPKPSSSPTPQATPDTSTTPVSDANNNFRNAANKLVVNPDNCKIKEMSTARLAQPFVLHNAVAFPFLPTSLPVKGNIKAKIIYLDWADLPGNEKDYSYYKQQFKMYKDFYWMVSENTLNINLEFSEKWFRVKGSYKDYLITAQDEPQYGPAPKKQKFYDAAVEASDAEINYSGVDIVFYAVPTEKTLFENGPHEFNFAYNAYLKTGEGNKYDIAAAGDFFLKNPGQPPWVYYVHETGHMIGVPHQANEDLNKPGVEKYLVTPLGGWDIMSNQGGGTRTITSWLRWLAGWLTDQQVVCVKEDMLTENYYELNPINEVAGKIESLVIKMDDTKVIVVESRRHDPVFDIETGNSKNGVIVYTVDALKGPAQGNQVLLSPRDIKNYLREANTFPDWRELDVIMKKGDSVQFENIKVEVVEIGTKSDIVKVTRTGNFTPRPVPITRPSPRPESTPSPSTTPSQSTSGSSLDLSDKSCTTEGEILQNSFAKFQCIKRSDSGVLLWSKSN